jgi:hypothetical protein
MKKILFLALLAVASFGFQPAANADLVILGVIDGDLTGGNPKAVVVQVTAEIMDLSIYGLGSANNGGGTDGEEFNFAADSASAGDKLIITGNSDSADFFLNNYAITVNATDNFANINGDDAIELFQNAIVIDTYGDPDTNGDGETWDYSDGFAVRTGGTAGAFDQANYDSQAFVLDGLTEAEQATLLDNAFGFTSAVPEPGTAMALGLVGLGLLRRRRS